jgi:hypothetical protein
MRVLSFSSLAQLVERSAVNRNVVGSSPTGGARAEQRNLCSVFLCTNSILQEGAGMLGDFIGAAFPWVFMGLFAAVSCSFMGKKKK